MNPVFYIYTKFFIVPSAGIADKEKTVLCHFLSAPRLMKKVAERIFIAPPKL